MPEWLTKEKMTHIEDSSKNDYPQHFYTNNALKYDEKNPDCTGKDMDLLIFYLPRIISIRTIGYRR